MTNGNVQSQYKPLNLPDMVGKEGHPVYQSLPPDGRCHNSRLTTFHQRNDNQPYLRQRTFSPPHQESNLFKTYSPFQAYQNHIAASKIPCEQVCSESEGRWRSPSASPLPLRSHSQGPDQQYNCGNTSPIILQRFYHQQKQQQLAREAEESSKSKFFFSFTY